MPSVAVSGRARLELPHPAGGGRKFVWRDGAFGLDDESVPVLAYDVSPSGWTDELTALHEDEGGSDHFIEIASRRHALTEVMRCLGDHQAGTVLEVGCSSGFLLRELRDALPKAMVIGADYTRGTLEALAKKLPGVPLVQFDLAQCPLPDDFADVTVLLNVLEHIGDDGAAVRHLFRITRPGGAVVIEVPAGASLFDIYDRVLMHQRRYDMAGLVALVEDANFTVERKSHLGALLFPAFYVSKRLHQWRYPAGGKVDEKEIVATNIRATRRSGRVMAPIMRLEASLRRHAYLPFGIRCLLTCRKPDRS
ncbi:class I SAM-dependent methyltransferase [soil metagenome]